MLRTTVELFVIGYRSIADFHFTSQAFDGVTFNDGAKLSDGPTEMQAGGRVNG